MELTNDFRVSAPRPAAWKLLTDVERIAPLLPGAQLQEVEGDEYRGVVKVKVGPITAQYKGVATFVERDEQAGKVVLRASGRDTRGQGNASALITAVMMADGEGTKVTVSTDLTVTGKVAQFGRGVLAEVSGKLIGQFVDALEADLERGQVPGASAGTDGVTGAGGSPTGAGAADMAAPRAGGHGLGAAGGAPDAGAPVVPAGGSTGLTAGPGVGPATTIPSPQSDGASAAAGPPTSAGPRRIDSPEPVPVDLLDAAGGSVLKRLAPLAGAAALIVALLMWRRGRRARRAGRSAAKAQDIRRLAVKRPSLPSVPSPRELAGHLPSVPSPRELAGHLPSVSARELAAQLPSVPGARELASRATRRRS